MDIEKPFKTVLCAVALSTAGWSISAHSRAHKVTDREHSTLMAEAQRETVTGATLFDADDHFPRIREAIKQRPEAPWPGRCPVANRAVQSHRLNLSSTNWASCICLITKV